MAGSRAGSLFCRKCNWSAKAASYFTVSRIGPTSEPPRGVVPIHQSAVGASSSNNAFAIVVIPLAVMALLCVCMFLLIFRNHRCRRAPATGSVTESESGNAAAGTSTAAAMASEMKSCSDDEGAATGGEKWRGQSIREEVVVVMAGEAVPTFLAHPAALAQYSNAAALVVQCPPLLSNYE